MINGVAEENWPRPFQLNKCDAAVPYAMMFLSSFTEQCPKSVDFAGEIPHGENKNEKKHHVPPVFTKNHQQPSPWHYYPAPGADCSLAPDGNIHEKKMVGQWGYLPKIWYISGQGMLMCCIVFPFQGQSPKPGTCKRGTFAAVISLVKSWM